MRYAVRGILASLVLVSLAACDDEETITGPQATVTGVAYYVERTPMPEGAVLTVLLQDVSVADATAVVIGEQVNPQPGQVPVAFAVPYDPAAIQANRTYSIRATITVGGQRRWMNTDYYGVITRGNPTSAIEVLLRNFPPS